MKKYTQEELDDVIALHQLWLEGFDTGIRANLIEANLRGANLEGANLREAKLLYVSLREANLEGADLTGAVIRKGDLGEANLRGADLSDSKLVRVSLREANLEGSCLKGVYLRNVLGNGKEVKNIRLKQSTYRVVLTSTHLHIGCQAHRIERWWEFSDKEILKMDGRTALKWWSEYKDTIKTIIEENK